MTKRVIVIDESAFIRGMLSEIINKSKDFKVVNRYRNIKDNLRSIKKLKADVLLLDLDRGKIDELKILKKDLLRDSDIKVLIVSHVPKEELGKEIKFDDENYIYVYIKEDFNAESVKAIEEVILNVLPRFNEEKKVKAKPIINRGKKKIEAVLIGASTGGPRALTKVLTSITKRIDVPILIVQHMPTGFTKAFAERLDRTCGQFKVREAEDGMSIERNCIYVAKGGIHMEVSKDRKIIFNDDRQIWGVKPAGDKLFVSAAEAYNGNVVACVLTGMGKDCSNGVVHVKKLGGINIAESEKTCLIYGMPRAAMETGTVDYILDIDKIGNKIEELLKGY